MAIVKFKKREELKILFAIKLPMIISELYKEVRNKKTANEIIRNSLNMAKNRVINTLELVDSFGNQFSVLVIYDNILEEKELLKYNMEIENIDFRILEFDFNGKMDEYYYYTEDKNKFYDELKSAIKSSETIYQWRRQYVRENKTGVVPTLTANMGTGGHNVPLILTKDKRIRKLTPKETFNAQGYPLDYKLPDNIAKGQLYKQAGNSVVVPLVNRIALNISNALDNSNNESNAINLNLPYVLTYTNMNGRYDGESYVYASSKDRNELEKIVEVNNQKNDSTPIEVFTNEEYLQFVLKNKNGTFYSIIEND
mgnify:CR=1 FL=1